MSDFSAAFLYELSYIKLDEIFVCGRLLPSLSILCTACQYIRPKKRNLVIKLQIKF